MRNFRLGAFLLFVVMLSQLFVFGVEARADVLTRNGDFSAGGDQWNINPSIPATWNPFVSGAANLHPPNSYNGEVIYQNLNVTGVGGKTLNFSCTMTNVSASTGSTIAFYVDYIDTASGSDKYISEHLYSPPNASITTNTAVPYNAFIFPATARKLVKFRIVKEGYGEFVIDNIQLAIPTGIVVGAVPQIISVSSNSGSYGSSLTITGTNFSATQGKITIGGGSGTTISSWSDTSISATVVDPARSGGVVVVSDFTESNGNNFYTVTSPNFMVDLMARKVQVVRGEIAELVLKTTMLNGFSTTTGISFTVNGLPGATTPSFTPIPIKRDGGVVLRIPTNPLPVGIYDLTIAASEATTASRIITGSLVVTSTAALDFYQTNPQTYQQSKITSLAISQQGSVWGLNAIGSDSGGMPVNDIQVVSSNPFVFSAYKNAFGTYDYYAHGNGSVTLTATAPDGTSKQLPVTVNFPDIPNVVISLNPQTITNKYEGFVDEWITFNTQPGQSQSISAGWSGIVTYVPGTSTLDFTYPQTDPPSYGGHFKVDHTKTQLGMYMHYGGISGGTASAANYVPLIITNDPTYAGLSLTIKSLDSSIVPHMYEYFDVEFHDNAGNYLFTRSNMTFSMGEDFFLGAIDPGSYKIRLKPMGTQILPQWYPNAESAAEAQLITFTAGVNDGPRYFFARKAPDITPPFVNEFTVPTTSSTLLVSGIILSGYDGDSGMSAYCLTETNNSASCTWQTLAPTSFTFSASGTRTLYAFLKDAAGNISVTDTTSTRQVNIVLEFPLTLAFGGTGGGQVNGAISCVSGSACSPVTFPETPGVSLVATPDTDSTFVGWSGCNSVSGTSGTTCNVTVNAIKTVTASFKAAPKVKIEGGSVDGYTTLRLAYDAASSNAQTPSTIQARSILLPDAAFSFDRPISVTVKGGYDSSFSTVNAGVSTIAGPVTFKGGPVTVEKLAIK